MRGLFFARNDPIPLTRLRINFHYVSHEAEYRDNSNELDRIILQAAPRPFIALEADANTISLPEIHQRSMAIRRIGPSSPD